MKYLLAHGADPNAWTRINLRVPLGAAYSPMYVAASQGNREILGYLRSHGADVNAEWLLDRNPSQTTLGATILAGDVRGTQLLIEYGADVNHVPRRGDMPLMQTVWAPSDPSGGRLCALAQLSGNRALASRILAAIQEAANRRESRL